MEFRRTSPPAPLLQGEGSKIVPPSLLGNRSFSEEVRGLGLQLINTDAAAEDAHDFAGILGRLWLAPFADFGVAQAIEGVNGAVDDFGRTNNQDFEGDSVGF